MHLKIGAFVQWISWFITKLITYIHVPCSHGKLQRWIQSHWSPKLNNFYISYWKGEILRVLRCIFGSQEINSSANLPLGISINQCKERTLVLCETFFQNMQDFEVGAYDYDHNFFFMISVFRKLLNII